MTTTNFSSGTVIASNWLNDVDDIVYQGIIATNSTTLRTLQARAGEIVNVKDFGAVGDGVVDDHAAFAAAWAAIKSKGGTLFIPPGEYYLNSQVIFDVDLSFPYFYHIIGYGAELYAGTSVTSHALKVYRGFNNFGVTIEGLHFNHRGNTTVGGCIKSEGTANLRIINCSVEHHNTKAGYSGIELGSYNPGDVDANSFWTLVDGFRTRKRSGGDGANAACGIKLSGSANATHIKNCSFGGVDDAIILQTDGVSIGMPNAVRIIENDFEGVERCVTINTVAPATTMPTGLKCAFNRVESATTFFHIGNNTLTDPGYPPALFENYLTVGSVTNYLVNPNNQYMFVNEASYFGVVPVRNIVGGPSGYRIITDASGANLEITRIDGAPGSFDRGHLVLCGYHIWVNDADGKLYMKGSAPTSATDGTVVGTQV